MRVLPAISPLVPVAVVCALWIAACNPFAPALDDESSGSGGLSDQRTIEGVFQNFRYAYTYKDTLVYGQLLAPDFVFVYTNHEKGTDVTWGRDEDMRSTYGLFQTAQKLDLVWNGIVTVVGDSLLTDVSRGFDLTVTFNPGDVIRVDGRVNLRLARSSVEEPWRIQRWKDDSF